MREVLKLGTTGRALLKQLKQLRLTGRRPAIIAGKRVASIASIA